MNIIDRIKRRRRINRAVRELSSLGDKILLDIGMERGNIAEMVEKMIDSNAAASKRPLERYEQARHPAGYRVSSGATA